MGGRTELQCLQHWQHVLNPKVVKGKGSWTSKEDSILLDKYKELGRKWSKISKFLDGRIGKQCRERFINHLDPELKKGPWTPEEDNILIKAQAQMVNR
jgi:hypothetical protein